LCSCGSDFRQMGILPQFISHTWTSFWEKLGINHITTTTFLPQTNWMVELAHRELKNALWAHLARSELPHYLPWVLLGSVLSAELAFGSTLTLRGQFLDTTKPLTDSVLEHRRATQPLLSSRLPPHPHHPDDCGICIYQETECTVVPSLADLKIIVLSLPLL
jgi:hypothetical protein